MEDSPCAVRVAIDLNYDSLMSEKVKDHHKHLQ